MQHRNGVPHVTTLVFRIDSAPRGASILGIAVPAKAAAQTLSVTRRVSQTSQRRNGGDDDHYRAAREEEGACASTAVRFCTDSGTALTAHALHKMSHVHLDAELDGPPPPTRTHDTQRRPPPRQRASPSHSHPHSPPPPSPPPLPSSSCENRNPPESVTCRTGCLRIVLERSTTLCEKKKGVNER
ncbi:hypothetical protein B0H16DRAFT_1699989, partial [Mycena metata]